MPRAKKPVTATPQTEEPILITLESWEKLFLDNGTTLIRIGDLNAITVDNFYQLIKQRLINDLRVNTRSSSMMASLQDEGY